MRSIFYFVFIFHTRPIDLFQTISLSIVQLMSSLVNNVIGVDKKKSCYIKILKYATFKFSKHYTLYIFLSNVSI